MAEAISRVFPNMDSWTMRTFMMMPFRISRYAGAVRSARNRDGPDVLGHTGIRDRHRTARQRHDNDPPTTRRATVDAKTWDDRYAAHDLVWSVEPNRFVAEIIGPLTPGHAVDLAAGEGRNAIWMVEQGWTVLASDYSTVAVERMRSLAADRLGADVGRLTPVVADATQPMPGATAAYDLALLCYLQLPADEWALALRSAVEALRPGGRVVVIG